MNTGILILVLLALSSAARPANGLDVCSMKPKEIDDAVIDRYTRIHIPLGKDMTCEEYLSCDLQERERISKCDSMLVTSCSFDSHIVSLGEPVKNVVWTHVLVKCERLRDSNPWLQWI